MVGKNEKRAVAAVYIDVTCYTPRRFSEPIRTLASLPTSTIPGSLAVSSILPAILFTLQDLDIRPDSIYLN